MSAPLSSLYRRATVWSLACAPVVGAASAALFLVQAFISMGWVDRHGMVAAGSLSMSVLRVTAPELAFATTATAAAISLHRYRQADAEGPIGHGRGGGLLGVTVVAAFFLVAAAGLIAAIVGLQLRGGHVEYLWHFLSPDDVAHGAAVSVFYGTVLAATWARVAPLVMRASWGVAATAAAAWIAARASAALMGVGIAAAIGMAQH